MDPIFNLSPRQVAEMRNEWDAKERRERIAIQVFSVMIGKGYEKTFAAKEAVKAAEELIKELDQ